MSYTISGRLSVSACSLLVLRMPARSFFCSHAARLTVEHMHTPVGEWKEKSPSMPAACYTTPRSRAPLSFVFFFFSFFAPTRSIFPCARARRARQNRRGGTLEICISKHYTRNCEHDGSNGRGEEKREGKTSDELLFACLRVCVCRGERNIAIALFNPDRATGKHVLSSFKKVPVFFPFFR